MVWGRTSGGGTEVQGGLWADRGGGAGKARVSDGRRGRRNRERAVGSGASAWWRSTILDGIRMSYFEWHQQYSASCAGRDVAGSESRTLSWTHFSASQCEPNRRARSRPESESGSSTSAGPRSCERGGMALFARYDLCARFVRTIRAPLVPSIRPIARPLYCDGRVAKG